MRTNYKNKSFFHRLKDKWQRRNKGNIFLLIKNYYYYFKIKIFSERKFKRQHLIAQIKEDSIIGEIGVWKGEFSQKILDYAKPKFFFLVDSWIFDEKVRGCAPQVQGQEPINQEFFDDAYNETSLKFADCKNVVIYKNNSIEASKFFDNNYFDYIYIDAEHSYKAVKQDLDIWYPKLKKNGYIFGDDYHWRENDYSLSVEKAYQEFFQFKNITNWCVFKSQIIFKKNEN